MPPPRAPTARRRTIRKAAPLIILLLWGVAGATLNVAVAWGLVLIWPTGPFVMSSTSNQFVSTQTLQSRTIRYDKLDSAGFPLQTLGWPPSSRDSREFVLPSEVANLPWTGFPMPLIPSFPEFAINTLFYAGVLWMLFATPFALRRMIRRRRGQCPHCAYPIGTSEVCTECGSAVTAKASRHRGIE
jgi:hypothetical protein